MTNKTVLSEFIAAGPGTHIHGLWLAAGADKGVGAAVRKHVWWHSGLQVILEDHCLLLEEGWWVDG